MAATLLGLAQALAAIGDFLKDVEFECKSFSTITDGTHKISVDWVDLVWAAVTYGNGNASQLIAYKWHSIAELIVRAHSVYAYLRDGSTGYEKSDLYSKLDATEKGAASYFLGMTMCKIFAAQKLNRPWLFHVSLASSNGASIVFSKMSKERPDLVGYTANSNWIVAEAKGRSKKLSTKALVKAKNQSRMIKSVNGTLPLHRFGIQTYFDPHLKVNVEDPPASREAYPVDIDLREALVNYYSLTSTLSRHGERREIGGEQYLVSTDPRSGLSVGLPVKIATQPVLQSRAAELHREPKYVSDREKIYSDGIYVSLDERWAPTNMSKQPNDRSGG